MKRLPIILTLIIGLTVNCYSQWKNSDYILLVRYSEHTICKVLDINGQKVDYDRHHCDDHLADIDNFSEYFPSKRIFYYDGEVSLSNEDKVILWDYVPVISNLPLEHSEIKIDAILNGSILQFNINNKEIELSPKGLYRDTLNYTERKNNKRIEYTTAFRVENLGLIKRTNIIDNKDWELKRIELGLTPITVVISPDTEYKGEQKVLADYLITNIDFSLLDGLGVENKTLAFEFYTDENGEVAEVIFLRIINPTFDKHVFDLINNMPKLEYGMNENGDIPAKIRVIINTE